MVHPAYLVYEHCFQANETNQKKKKEKKGKGKEKKKTNKQTPGTNKQTKRHAETENILDFLFYHLKVLCKKNEINGIKQQQRSQLSQIIEGSFTYPPLVYFLRIEYVTATQLVTKVLGHEEVIFCLFI